MVLNPWFSYWIREINCYISGTLHSQAVLIGWRFGDFQPFFPVVKIWQPASNWNKVPGLYYIGHPSSSELFWVVWIWQLPPKFQLNAESSARIHKKTKRQPSRVSSFTSGGCELSSPTSTRQSSNPLQLTTTFHQTRWSARPATGKHQRLSFGTDPIVQDFQRLREMQVAG